MSGSKRATINVGELKKQIASLSDDDIVYAYDGEVTGLVFLSTKERAGEEWNEKCFWKETLFIPTCEPEITEQSQE